MHYGYVGRIAGFSESELLDGAGLGQIPTNINLLGDLPQKASDLIGQLIDNPWDINSASKLGDVVSAIGKVVVNGSNQNANLFDPSSIDDPGDQASIKDGFRLYNKAKNGISAEDFKQDLRSNESTLSNAYQWPV